MKKTVFLGLLAMMLAFGFIGCDTGNGGNPDRIKQSDFYGKWEYEGNTGNENDQFVEISATVVHFSMPDGSFVKMSITSWVEIGNSGYNSYSKGYTISGTLLDRL